MTTWFTLPPASAPQAVDIPALAVTVPAIAVPDPVPIDVPPLQVALPSAPAVAPAMTTVGAAGGPGQGAETDSGKGTGTGTGTGTDVGPGTGGEGGRSFPASPVWSNLPPHDVPSADRGRHEVRFWVTADGRVTRIEIVPPIKDAGFRRQFVERLMGYRFKPATTVDGRRIASVTTVTFTF